MTLSESEVGPEDRQLGVVETRQARLDQSEFSIWDLYQSDLDTHKIWDSAIT